VDLAELRYVLTKTGDSRLTDEELDDVVEALGATAGQTKVKIDEIVQVLVSS